MAEVTKTKKCPICNNEYDAVAPYCQTCGWEFKFIIADNSEYVKLESNRKGVTKRHIEGLNSEIRDLNSRIEDLNSQIKILKNEIGSLKNRPAPAPAAPQSQMAGVMCLTNLRSEITTYMPIYKGINTYGSDDSSGAHQKINMIFRGNVLQPKHFSVEYRDEHLLLSPLAGNVILCNGVEIPSKGQYIYPDSIISISDQLEIRMTLI